mmetsp:Transcript_9355/g.20079  ORF Transcript_9355/g.20079 Transcript_9355/m.20079 type:complete len:361 (-) Transcript_9355:9-1091(-)
MVPSDDKDLQADLDDSRPTASPRVQLERAPASYGSIGPREIANQQSSDLELDNTEMGLETSHARPFEAIGMCRTHTENDSLISPKMFKKPFRCKNSESAADEEQALPSSQNDSNDSDESWDSLELLSQEQALWSRTAPVLLHKPLDLSKVLSVPSQRRCEGRLTPHDASCFENTVRQSHGDEDFDDIGFEGHCGNLALRLSGRKEKESEQWCDNESMQFDRDRVSWRGNEAVLNDFADLEWPDPHYDEPAAAHDAALAASLASTRPRLPLWDCSVGSESRCRRADSDTEQLASPLRSSGSWGATDASWGDVHTPRNVATADSAFVMAPETLAALLACQSKSELGAWLRDGMAPWDTPADI